MFNFQIELVPFAFVTIFIFWIFLPLYELFRYKDVHIDYGNKIMETYIKLVQDRRIK